MKTAQDSYPIKYKRKCEVSGEDATWKSLTWSKIQNGRLSASIYFHMPAIW